MRVLASLIAFALASPAFADLLRPGEPFPDWTLTDHTGTERSASELTGRSYLLWFYPRAMTPGCTMEGRALRDRSEDFAKRGVEILGVSFDTPGENARFVETEGFPFALLSDTERHLALRVGAATRRDQQAAQRISYLVGPDGHVRAAYGNVDPRNHAGRVLADIDASPDIPEPIRRAVEADDRTAADRALDEGRRPMQMLAFFGIEPGMRVAELGVGRGYTAELLARVVGPEGQVYGHNTPYILKRFAAAPWSERLQKDVMENVIRLDRPFDDPFPADVKGLDAVLIVLFYHDTVWMEVDRDEMNRRIFRALRPGGVYGIVDHSAAPGTGTEATKSLHRIEEEVVRSEVERAGFQLADTADFLRNPDDSRDWNAAPGAAGERRGTSDRFVLRFVKPESGGRPTAVSP